MILLEIIKQDYLPWLYGLFVHFKLIMWKIYGPR